MIIRVNFLKYIKMYIQVIFPNWPQVKIFKGQNGLRSKYLQVKLVPSQNGLKS